MEELICPLQGEVVRNHKHGLLAQAKSFALHSGCCHFKCFARTNFVCEQSISTIKHMSDSVSLMFTEGNIRVHTAETDMTAIILTGSGGVKEFVVLCDQSFTTARVFPDPILERILDRLLFLLCQSGILFIQDTLLLSICIFVGVVDTNIFQIQRFFQNTIGIGTVSTVGVFFATLVMINRPGLEYQDALLYPSTEGDFQIYQGTVDGETARFAVSPEWEVSYQWGDYTYGPYQITEDPAAVPDGYEGSQGIEIRLGDEVLFRGCYLPGSTLSLIQEDGEPGWGLRYSVSTGADTVIVADGREAERHTPDLSAVARVALEPELTHRGSMGLYLAVTLLTLFNIIQICFPHLFFRLSLLGRVRNIDDAEPSDFYIAMEQIEWVVLALACLLFYYMAMTTIQ